MGKQVISGRQLLPYRFNFMARLKFRDSRSHKQSARNTFTGQKLHEGINFRPKQNFQNVFLVPSFVYNTKHSISTHTCAHLWCGSPAINSEVRARACVCVCVCMYLHL
jgi:hypothetical protein